VQSNDDGGQNRPARSLLNINVLLPFEGGENRPIGSVAPLARCTTSRCATRLAEWTDFPPSNASI
jgi:hypothetical protein